MTTATEEIIDGHLVRTYPNGTVERIPLSDTSDPAPVPALRILTHKQFRDLLSLGEQRLLDNFSVQEFVDTEPRIQALTVIDRANVRTAVATFRDAQYVDLEDPATVQFVTLLGALNLWDEPSAERVEQILRGAQ